MGIMHAVVKCKGQPNIYSPRQIFGRPVHVGQILTFLEDRWEATLKNIEEDGPYHFLDMGVHDAETRERLLRTGWSVERPRSATSAA